MAAGLWNGLRDGLVRAEERSVLDMQRSRASRSGRMWEPSGLGPRPVDTGSAQPQGCPLLPPPPRHLCPCGEIRLPPVWGKWTLALSVSVLLGHLEPRSHRSRVARTQPHAVRGQGHAH